MSQRKRKNLSEEGIKELKILVLLRWWIQKVSLVDFRLWAGRRKPKGQSMYGNLLGAALYFLRGCLNGGAWIGLIRVRNVKYLR